MFFEDDNYTYRIFCTDLAGKAHDVIFEYDKRADVENLVGEAKREGLEMIFMKRSPRSSRVTGPKIRVPIGCS